MESDTLPQWIYQRFAKDNLTYGNREWYELSDDDRLFWEHEAQAVRRAVARNGFKADDNG